MYILEFLDHVGFSQWSQYPDEEFNLADDSKWEVRNLLLIIISVSHKFRNFIIIFFILLTYFFLYFSLFVDYKYINNIVTTIIEIYSWIFYIILLLSFICLK